MQYMNTSQIDAALHAAGYFDNKLASVNYVGVRRDGDILAMHGSDVGPSDEYVYEICFYDDNTGHLALGYVFIRKAEDGRTVGEFGTKVVDLTMEVK